MVVYFDSDLALCALLLGMAAALGWFLASGARAPVRVNLRFAAVLFAALAVSAFASALWPEYTDAALGVALLTASLGSAALGLGVFASLSRPPPPLLASLALAAGLALGLIACLSGENIFALAALIPSVAVMLALGFGSLGLSPRKAVLTLLGAALLCGGMALMENALAPLLLFFAAALMGLACASQKRVEQQSGAALLRAIGRPRL